MPPPNRLPKRNPIPPKKPTEYWKTHPYLPWASPPPPTPHSAIEYSYQSPQAHPDDIAISRHTSPGCGRIGCFRPEKSTWDIVQHQAARPGSRAELPFGGSASFPRGARILAAWCRREGRFGGWMMGAMAGLRKGIGHQKWAAGSDSWV
jgi:hypothetical protein